MVIVVDKNKYSLQPAEHQDPLYVAYVANLLKPPGKNREIDEGLSNWFKIITLLHFYSIFLHLN
jgi:hypothetical protein